MNYLLPVGLLVISFVVSMFYTSPLLTRISALGDEQASLTNFLTESRNLETTLAEKEDLYKEFTDDERIKINKILPESIDNVQLIIDIDNIASKYSMKVRNIDLKMESPGADSSNNAYGTATLRFAVSATYNNFQSFLADLEDSLRIVDISAVSFTSGDRDTNEYNIELKTYWLKEII